MKKRLLCLLLIFLLLTLSTAVPVMGAGAKEEILVVSGKHLPILHFDEGQYVSLYALCLALGQSSADFKAQEDISIHVTKGELSATAVDGEYFIEANGRYLYNDHPNLYRNKVLYVPLSSAVEAVGGRLVRIENGYHYLETNDVAAIRTGDEFYDKDCVLWLGRIIQAESGNQPLAGKIAVGTVVMNRVDSPKYPNTIYGVIFDHKYGVQFTPTVNGAIWCEPSSESVLAAKIVLDGYRTDPDILFFMNEDIAVSTWISDNCDYAFTIADHSFWS